MSPIFCCLELIAKIKKAKEAKGQLDSDEEDTGGGESDVDDEN